MTIPFVIIGIGNLAGRILSALKPKYKLVGAFDIDQSKIGKTVGQIVGGDVGGNTLVEDVKFFHQFLENNTVRVCFILTSGCMKDIFPYAYLCLTNSVNVITSCEEAFAPEKNDMVIMLEKLCIQNRCSFVGSGFRELMWGQLINSLSSGLGEIHTIKMECKYSLFGCNEESMCNHGVGYTDEEYEQMVVASKVPPMMWNVHIWICRTLGLEARSDSIMKNPVYINGKIVGTEVTIVTETIQRIKVYSKSTGILTSAQFKAEMSIELEGDTTIVVRANELEATAITANVLRNKMYAMIEEST